MAGTFTEAALTRPTLPGAYTRYTAQRRAALAAAPGGVVAVPFTSDWGPINVPTLLTEWDDYEPTYGPNVTPGRIAVYGAFKGEGIDGYGGASQVLALRSAGAGAAPAQVVVNNAAAAPAITFVAKYPGTRANGVRIVASPIVNNQQTISVLDGTATVESYTYTITTPAALQGLIDRIDGASGLLSDLVLTAEGATGLAPGTFTLAGGSDGADLGLPEWTSLVQQFKFQEYAAFAPDDLAWSQDAGDQAIRDTVAMLVAWRQQEEDEGHRFLLVVGGALDETMTDALARAQACSDPGTLTVGGPGVDDDDFGPLSTSQLAPRYAGIRVQRGESMATHFARLAGTVPRPNPDGTPVSLLDLEAAVQGGVVALQRDRYTLAPTRVVKDVTTWSTDTPDMPVEVYGNAKYVMTMQQFANTAEAEIEQQMIGKVTVNTASRSAAAARVLRLVRTRERTGALNPGTIVEAVPGQPTDDFIQVKVTLTFGRALAQLFLTGTVQ